MRWANRRDGNQTEIQKALELMGCSVQDLSRVGEGCPDLLVARAGVTILVEVKTATGKLRESQRRFRESWRGRIEVIRSVDEAVDVVNRLL